MHGAIRADGNTNIGYGHLFASNTVTRALQESGTLVSYLTKTPNLASAACINQAKFVIIDYRSLNFVAAEHREPSALLETN